MVTDSGEIMWDSSFYVTIATWLNAFHRMCARMNRGEMFVKWNMLTVLIIIYNACQDVFTSVELSPLSQGGFISISNDDVLAGWYHHRPREVCSSPQLSWSLPLSCISISCLSRVFSFCVTPVYHIHTFLVCEMVLGGCMVCEDGLVGGDCDHQDVIFISTIEATLGRWRKLYWGKQTWKQTILRNVQ